MSQGDLSGFFGGAAFDPNSVKPAEDFDVLPPGKYPVQIEKTETKLTKARTGHYLELQLLVLDGPGKGRRLWNRLNIDNPDATCVEIARRVLSALCKATIGDEKLVNENQLLQKMCIASVKVDKSGNNAIRTYAKFAVAAPPVQAPPAQAVQQPAVQPVQQPGIPVLMQNQPVAQPQGTTQQLPWMRPGEPPPF